MVYFLVGYIKFDDGKIGGVYYEKETKTYMHSPIGSSFKKIVMHPDADNLKPLKLERGKKGVAEEMTGEIIVNKAVAFQVGALIP